MGESVTEGTVLEWHKQVGDEVEADETVVEVSTDKVDAEVPAPADGVITEILVEPDETVPVGTVLAQVAVGATAGDVEAAGNGAATSSDDGAERPTAHRPEGGGTPASDGDAGVAGTPGNGSGPSLAPDTGESVVEEAEHGAAAEEEGTRAAEAASREGGSATTADLATGAPTHAPPAADLIDVMLPQLGESVAEGTVLEWLRAVGDAVEADETVVEISTDKVDAEVPAPAAGTIAEILVDVDETVAIGTVLCRIAVGEGAPAAPPTLAPSEPSAAGRPPADAPPDPVDGEADATPVARRIAGAHGIDLGSVPGTGPRGRVNKTDVLAAVEANGSGAAAPAVDAKATSPGAEIGAADAAPPPPTPAARPEANHRPIRGPAATLARFMNESRSIPTATSFRTLSVDTLDARRRALKAAGRKLSFTHLIAWAIVEAAREMPVMAHAYAEENGKPQLVEPAGLDLGLAVDVEKRDGSRALVTPVVQDAGSLDLQGFVARYDELVAGARDGTLSPAAYSGANITLTNPGGIGTVASVPRLMVGQGTIIATGAIGYPVGFEKVDTDRLRELGVSKTMTMTSTYDHRVIQGAQSGAFLKRIDELLAGGDGFYEAVFSALGAAGPGTEEGVSAPVTDGAGAGPITSAEPVASPITPGAGEGPDLGMLQAVQAATSVVKAHRMHGHLWARLDPLGSEPEGDPALDPRNVHLTPELMRAIPASVLRVAVPGETFGEALPHLQEIYCGTIAYEFEHISNHDERVWLRQTVESGEHRRALSPEEKCTQLERLTQVEALENYLHKAFLGRKQFSIEGLDTLVPMLDETIELAALAGAREVVLGMAHRGRLNVLAHAVGRPYESILVEFEGEQQLSTDTAAPEGGTGDVKYHHGASGTYRTKDGRGITVTLSPNPSHLEYVDPVVEGRARADQSSRKGRDLHHDPTLVLPVLIHGDAAFPGQGVVAETLNLQSLRGYSTGGTIHIITNNQLGFTTERQDARSTTYASDLAKGYEIPVVHVNADDPEACLAATRLAYAYRERFHKDFLIDLIGYRRFGHNEGDEPAYTQPVMYQKIKDHPTVREIWAREIEDRGVITAEEAEGMVEEIQARMEEIRKKPKDEVGDDDLETEQPHTPVVEIPETAVPAEKLVELNAALLERPEGFTPNTKLERLLRKTRETLGESGEERIDWAHAETLAFASLLEDGVPIRLTGQDSERGTFSQRHLVLHDEKVGEDYVPMQNIPQAKASFAVHNSPLSEIAVMGFEYGYTMNADDALVLWEAQYGDFANVGQPMIDQFIVSGQAKWGETSGLVMLLPHGYEGQGPEHSSARLERFLQLAAMENVRIANLTTAAQYFHLLRAQAQLKENKRPLVIMAPKSLLRHAMAASGLREFSEGRFRTVLDDEGARGRAEDIERLILCSGKFYTELAESDTRKENDSTAVVRVELLYPWPGESIREILEGYPNLREVAWAQEEPANMGAWTFVRPRLEELLEGEVPLRYVGKPARPSPAQGSARYHKEEHAAIVRGAFEKNGHEERDKQVVEATQERASSPSA